MASDSFRFKQFAVMQKESGMKVGTDGVLLGSWSGSPALKNFKGELLDIGTGTGVISLIIAQRVGGVNITAVEVEEGAAREAKYNFLQSPWSDRLNVNHTTFQAFSREEENKEKFDIIVTNPPYFINSLKNESQSRLAARHTELLPYEDLVDGICSVIKPSGTLFIILPFDQASIFIALAALKGLNLCKRVDVRGAIGKPIKRVLMEFRYEKCDCISTQMEIEKEQRGDYSDKYRELTSDLYLKF